MTGPLPIWMAGSGSITRWISCSSFSQFRRPFRSFSRASAPFSRSLMGSVSARPLPSCIISRGLAFPEAMRPRMRSRSPNLPRSVWVSSRISGFSVKYWTTSYRAFSSLRSMMGMASQLRSMRAPMGLEHLSRVCTSDTPSAPEALWKTSRLRRVNLSIHTNLASSMRPMVQMFLRPVCWVCSRYTSRAPALQMPSG